MTHLSQPRGRSLSACPACCEPLAAGSGLLAHDYLSGQSFRIVTCAACSVSWTSPVPDDMNLYYPEQYRRYVPAVACALSLLYRWRVRHWCRAFIQPGAALEIGCGDGIMLDALRHRGWRVCGTERTEAMAQNAREKYGLQVYVPPDRPLPGRNAYDLIVMFQVLEHLADPVTALRDARELLTAEGRVIVGVPNFASWQARFGHAGWLHLDAPRHLVHFTPAGLATTAARAGLRLSGVRFSSPEHDPYGWIQTILNRWGGNENRLTKLLMGIAPWRIKDVPTLFAVAILGPISLILALTSWACGAGAIMEATLVRDEALS